MRGKPHGLHRLRLPACPSPYPRHRHRLRELSTCARGRRLHTWPTTSSRAPSGKCETLYHGRSVIIQFWSPGSFLTSGVRTCASGCFTSLFSQYMTPFGLRARVSWRQCCTTICDRAPAVSKAVLAGTLDLVRTLYPDCTPMSSLRSCSASCQRVCTSAGVILRVCGSKTQRSRGSARSSFLPSSHCRSRVPSWSRSLSCGVFSARSLYGCPRPAVAGRSNMPTLCCASYQAFGGRRCIREERKPRCETTLRGGDGCAYRRRVCSPKASQDLAASCSFLGMAGAACLLPRRRRCGHPSTANMRMGP